jgi:glutamate/tyrosine decarboxylase-like PLP-dependent enzyme
MVTSMLHGDPATCAGSMTSGGTESILLAIKAYRDQVFARVYSYLPPVLRFRMA